MTATSRDQQSASESALDRLRSLCLSLPEVAEKEDWSNAFQVRGKTFCEYVSNHHGDGIVGAWCKAPPGVQGLLVDAARDRFYVPPYMGGHGWVGVRLDREVDWPQLASIIEDAYVLSAPKRLAVDLASHRPLGLETWAATTTPATIEVPSAEETAALETVRKACLALPGTSESEAFGRPVFKVRGKTFAMWNGGDFVADEVTFWCKAPQGAQQELVAANPARYFVPMYLGAKGWVGVRLNGAVDWDETAAVLRDAYLSAAPVTLARQVKAAQA